MLNFTTKTIITIESDTAIIGNYMAKGTHVWPICNPGTYINNPATMLANA